MKRRMLIVIMLTGAAGYGAICLHSVQEIHYLKSFFPGRFTVEEAFYAAAVELIKITIVGIPLLIFLALCAFFLRQGDGSRR